MRDQQRQPVRIQRPALIVFGCGVLVLALLVLTGTRVEDLFSTPNQRGARALARGEFKVAATQFVHPTWRGFAQFRAGEFKSAALNFSARNDALAAFNRGNSQVMLGEYESAMESYDRALSEKPGWEPAVFNRELARLRYAAVNPDVEEGQGTDGQMGADEIVFDNVGGKGDTVQTQVGEGKTLSEEETQALWLRSVQTEPADFLRAKFAFQQHQRKGEPGGQ